MNRIKLLLILASMCSVSWTTDAGIDDHILYDKATRQTLAGLDALVEIDVVHYYAFSEPYILYNYLNERNRFNREMKRGPIEVQDTDYWSSEPFINAYAMLMRHSLWVIDARVKSCLDGKCETKWVRIALQYTPAFGPRESPKHVCVRDDGVDRMVLGLVWLDKEEFLLGFRDKLCFLTDDLGFVDLKKDLILDSRYFTVYENAMIQPPVDTSGNNNLSSNEITYCVMRDLNIQKIRSDEDFMEMFRAKHRGYSMMEEGPLLKALNIALSEEEELMHSLNIKVPLPSPLVLERVGELRKSKHKKAGSGLKIQE